MQPNDSTNPVNDTDTQNTNASQKDIPQAAVDRSTQDDSNDRSVTKRSSGKAVTILVSMLIVFIGIIYAFPDVFRIDIPSFDNGSSRSSVSSSGTATVYGDEPSYITSDDMPKPSFEQWIHILVACVIATAIFTILTTFMAISMNAKMSAMIEIAKEMRDSSSDTTP